MAELATAPDAPVMEVQGLAVTFPSHAGPLRAVGGISYALRRGETLTILGESGSGKSVGLKATMGLLPPHAAVSGSVRVRGSDVLCLPPRELAKLRGGAISMIFQEPMAALDPVYTIGEQIAEAVVKHEGVDRRRARARAVEMLEHVRIPSARRRMDNFPHEMSGGMRQRAMIALALACSPAVLLADEPTTALDVTVQIQILLLLRQLQAELGMAVVFVTHDVGVAAEISDRVAVMYAGRFVETGSVREVLRNPRHPYTAGLLASTVHGAKRGAPLGTIPGSPPSLAHLPPGCAFVPRCRFAVSQCREDPPLRRPAPDLAVRCIHDAPVRQRAEALSA